MILYLDASALVKRYVKETGTEEIAEIISQADLVGTALVSRAEVGAALAKAVRVGAISPEEGSVSLNAFRSEWSDLIRVQVTETVIARAETFAWELGLRGYDAVHLASATIWQETMGERAVMATFDGALWNAASKVGLSGFPHDLSTLAAKPRLPKRRRGSRG